MLPHASIFLVMWVDNFELSKKFFWDVFSYLAYGKRMAAIRAARMFIQTFVFLEVCIEMWSSNEPFVIYTTALHQQRMENI